MAFAVIVLAAMSRLSRENRARPFARLAAWNKRQVRLLERKAGQGAGRIARNAEREAGRLARGARLRNLKPGSWSFGRCVGLGAGDPGPGDSGLPGR